MDSLTKIKTSMGQIRLKTQKGLIFESLGDLMLPLRKNLAPSEVTPVMLPDDSQDALTIIEKYQDLWAHNDEHHFVTNDLSNSDLQLIVKQLASPNEKYRDTGAFFFLSMAIQNDHLSQEQLAWLTAEVIKDDALFSHLMEKPNNASFGRSYHLAILWMLLVKNRTSTRSFISEQLLDRVVDQVALISLIERDTRGFIDGKGWVHIFTHLANVLNELFMLPNLQRADKVYLTATIMTNFRLLDTPLTMGEVGKIVDALINLAQKNQLYADYILLSLKLWRQDIVNEPFIQNRSRWQQMYNRMDFFHEIIVAGADQVPKSIFEYVLTTKNYLS